MDHDGSYGSGIVVVVVLVGILFGILGELHFYIDIYRKGER